MAEAKADDVSPIGAVEKLLAELYLTQDKFFTSDKHEKETRIADQRAAVLKALGDLPEDSSVAHKARVAYVHGKALDAGPAYSEQAEVLLAKAVKLDPSNVDAWNSLGNCFWKKKDYVGARDCFNGALAQERTPASLRMLSMVLRQIGDAPAERVANVAESVAKAKEAVTLDVRDDESWYVLGNAYLTQFFSHSHDTAHLTQAMKAYAHADETSMSRNPDLHFNRGMVYKFQEEYTQAVAAFQAALAIDPSLPAADEVDGIQRHVARVSSMVERKGRIKPKKVAALVKSMPSAEMRKRLAESQAASADGGAAADAGGAGGASGEAKEGEGKTATSDDSAASAAFVKLSELAEGPNPGKWVLLKMLAPCLRTGQTPQCLVMVDEDAEAVCVSLYHAGESSCDRFDADRDVFIVCDPVVKQVRFDRDDGTTAEYRTLQVLKPHNFSVNGRTLSGQYAHAGLKVVNISS